MRRTTTVAADDAAAATSSADVDLAELDPPSADLDLVVGAALEQQALRLEPHEVAAER